jgi:pyrroline-5-carboxylate reductase
MSIKFSATDNAPAVLAAAETFVADAMEDLVGAIAAVRQGNLTEAKAAVLAVRDLKQAFYGLMEERNRVEKLRKQVAGDVGTGSLDLDAARDEIGRRLACLRDASPG